MIFLNKSEITIQTYPIDFCFLGENFSSPTSLKWPHSLRATREKMAYFQPMTPTQAQYPLHYMSTQFQAHAS